MLRKAASLANRLQALYSTRRRSTPTGIAPGRDSEGHSPDQEPEVPDEHVPAQGALVDGPGRGNHIGQAESTGEDRRPAVQDEDQAPDDTWQQEQSPSDAIAPRSHQSQREQPPGPLDQNHPDPQRQSGRRTISGETLERPAERIEQRRA